MNQRNHPKYLDPCSQLLHAMDPPMVGKEGLNGKLKLMSAINPKVT